MERILETDRLFLRNLQPQDAPVIHTYRSDPRCFRYQRWENTSAEAMDQFVRDYRNSRFLSDEEEQHYAICTREGRLAGDLSYFYTPQDCCITLGITLAPEYQQKGYGFEILTAVIKAAQQRHPALELVALIDKENCPSMALFEKLGFIRECYAASIASYVYVIPGSEDSEMKNLC